MLTASLRFCLVKYGTYPDVINVYNRNVFKHFCDNKLCSESKQEIVVIRRNVLDSLHENWIVHTRGASLT